MSDAQYFEQQHLLPWLTFILVPAFVIGSTVMSLASLA